MHYTIIIRVTENKVISDLKNNGERETVIFGEYRHRQKL